MWLVYNMSVFRVGLSRPLCRLNEVSYSTPSAEERIKISLETNPYKSPSAEIDRVPAKLGLPERLIRWLVNWFSPAFAATPRLFVWLSVVVCLTPPLVSTYLWIGHWQWLVANRYSGNTIPLSPFLEDVIFVTSAAWALITCCWVIRAYLVNKRF